MKATKRKWLKPPSRPMSDSNQKDPGRFGDDGAAVIQVTPGQIVGAALFLLVAAAIIFFAGMFVRGLAMTADETKAPPEPQQQREDMEHMAVLPAPDPVIEEPEPEPSPPEPEKEAKPAPEPDQEPVTFEAKPAVVEPEPTSAPVEEPEPEIKPAPPEPEPASEPEMVPEPKPEPEPVVESTPAQAEPAPLPLPEIPDSTAGGAYTVQVMSIGIAKRAQAELFQRDALENKDVQIELVESADGKRLQAFVGSYATKADASKARDALLRAGFDGCFVKKRDE